MGRRITQVRPTNNNREFRNKSFTAYKRKLVKKILGLKESGWMIEGLKALSEAREARNAGTLRWGGISPLSCHEGSRSIAPAQYFNLTYKSVCFIVRLAG